MFFGGKMRKRSAYFYLFVMGYITTVLSRFPFLIMGLFLITFGRDDKWMLLFGYTFIITVFLYALIEEIRIILTIKKSDHPFVKMVRDNLDSGEGFMEGMKAVELQMHGNGNIFYEADTPADIVLRDRMVDLMTEYISSVEENDTFTYAFKINILANDIDELVSEMNRFNESQYNMILDDDRRSIRRERLDKNSRVMFDRKSGDLDALRKWKESFNTEEGPAVGIRYAGVIVSAIGKIHEQRLLTGKYGRELPIIITDVIVNSYMRELNVRANGEELVDLVGRAFDRR